MSAREGRAHENVKYPVHNNTSNGVTPRGSIHEVDDDLANASGQRRGSPAVVWCVAPVPLF